MSNDLVPLCSNAKSERLLFRSVVILLSGTSMSASVEKVDSHRAVEQPKVATHAAMRIRIRKSFLIAVKHFQCTECSRSIASLSSGNEFSFGREGPKKLRSSGAQVVTLVETEDEIEGVSEGV